jgi:hypothetical protein
MILDGAVARSLHRNHDWPLTDAGREVVAECD